MLKPRQQDLFWDASIASTKIYSIAQLTEKMLESTDKVIRVPGVGSMDLCKAIKHTFVGGRFLVPEQTLSPMPSLRAWGQWLDVLCVGFWINFDAFITAFEELCGLGLDRFWLYLLLQAFFLQWLRRPCNWPFGPVRLPAFHRVRVEEICHFLNL